METASKYQTKNSTWDTVHQAKNYTNTWQSYEMLWWSAQASLILVDKQKKRKGARLRDFHSLVKFLPHSFDRSSCHTLGFKVGAAPRATKSRLGLWTKTSTRKFFFWIPILSKPSLEWSQHVNRPYNAFCKQKRLGLQKALPRVWAGRE